MPVSKVHSAAVYGINAYLVEVEVNLAPGAFYYTTVGLPDAAIRESQERIIAALDNSGFEPPIRKITVNLAPADVKKVGSTFDLPIAIGILVAEELIDSNLDNTMIFGELALDGRVKPIRGALSAAILAKEKGVGRIIVPEDNAKEAAIIEGVEVIGVSSLPQTVEYLTGKLSIMPVTVNVGEVFNSCEEDGPDFSEVKGQGHVKRALEVAAAGGHNFLMIGPPGSGKSMMAKRVPTILPDLTLEEAIETTRVHSISGKLNSGSSLLVKRPFRSPHHTASDVGLIGGGNQIPIPGEVSLANNGLLFLDELPEFKRNVLEALRQPLEDGEVTISRATMSVTLPARFTLAGAMNPCPCGYYTDPGRECACAINAIRNYRNRISGPLLDRIDIHIEAPAIKYQDMIGEQPGEPSSAIRERVIKARNIQSERFAGSKTYCNARMEGRHLRKHCEIDETCKAILKAAVVKLGLSARAHQKVLKVARTIADLDGERNIGAGHLAEAVQYRSLDRDTF